MRKLIDIFILMFMVGTLYAQPNILVLGTAQDGGYPHMGCKKQCCEQAWANPAMKRYVVSFAFIDPAHKQWWLFEATPDIKEQLQYFKTLTKGAYNYLPDGIFITHAHIGHYTGLMQLGREVMSTKDIPVYVMPRLKTFLETNGPWSQLVKLNNITIRELKAGIPIAVDDNVSVEAFTVPHRDEYSETVGFRIITANRKYLFIPDIDKWAKWDKDIIDAVAGVDIALLDATFYDGNELPNMRMSEVPHPFVTETMKLFINKDSTTKAKIHFIHLNHTNPLLWDKHKMKEVETAGFNIAVQGAYY